MTLEQGIVVVTREDRREDDRNHELARAQLDEASFAAAWAAGRALPLEQAIAEALRAADASETPRQAHT